MTRDGLPLETIQIRITKIGKRLKNTDRIYRADILPHEIAELTLSLLDALDETKDFAIQSLELAPFAGRDGYTAEAVYRTGDGLRKRVRIRGAPTNGYVCELMYDAADEVYFEKYLTVFDRIVASALTR